MRDGRFLKICGWEIIHDFFGHRLLRSAQKCWRDALNYKIVRASAENDLPPEQSTPKLDGRRQIKTANAAQLAQY